ncbi:hypothetical protein AB7M63_004833 [Bradyrhizobium japonicum]
MASALVGWVERSETQHLSSTRKHDGFRKCSIHPTASQTRLRVLAADSARVLLGHSTLETKRAQGRPGADLAPAVRCAKSSARKPHSSIQMVPITRPSLRDGRTAYAVLSREPSSFWPPSSLRKSPAPRRLTRLPHSQALDRSDDGQDHTVCRTHGPPFRRSFSSPVDGAGNLQTRRSLAAPLIRHEVLGSRRAIRPARTPRAQRCRVHRKPGSRNVTTQDRPSW